MPRTKTRTAAPGAAQPARRRYDSKRRARQAADTRTAVLHAARTLFGARGWAATGMRDIAREAGVSVETVYANFGSKPELLLAAIDVAVVGDAEPVPLADRSEFRQLGFGATSERARAGARLMRQIYARTYPLERTLHEGAAAHGVLADRVRDRETRRRLDVERGLTMVVGRPLDATEVDGLWALLSPQVYGLLVEAAGWDDDQYETWLGQTLVRLVTSDKERT